MRNNLILFCLLFNLTSNFAQLQDRFINNNPIPDTYNNIVSKANAYFAANPDLMEDGPNAKFNRWADFWKTRTQSANPAEYGTYLAAYNALYAQLNQSICASGVQGNWTNLGPHVTPMANGQQAQGIVTAVKFDPSDPSGNTIYAGTGCSGLWKGYNTGFGGWWWIPLTESLRLPGLGIRDIAISANGQTLYIATGIEGMGSYGLGVLTSTNAGVSWSATGLSFNPPASNGIVTKLLMVDPQTAQTIYALVDDKLYKTINGGITWPAIWQIPGSSMIYPANNTPCMDPWNCSYLTRVLADIALKPGNPNIIYLTTSDTPNSATACAVTCGTPVPNQSNGGCELWTSPDGGVSWTEITDVTTAPGLMSPLSSINPSITKTSWLEVETNPNEPNSIWICGGNDNAPQYNFTQKYAIPFGWQTPKAIPGITGNPWTDYPYHNFNISPNDINTFYIGGLYVDKSIDAGSTWTRLSDYYSDSPVLGGHADIRTITVENFYNTDAVLVGCDGGAFLSNGSPPWSNISKTLPITQFYGLAGSETNTALIIAGAQDNGVWTYHGANVSNPWTYQVIGDSYNCVIEHDNPNNCIAEYNTPGLMQSVDGGNTWPLGAAVPPYDPNVGTTRIRPIENNALNDNIYIGYQNVFNMQPPFFSNNWNQLSSFGVAGNLGAIAVAPSNSLVMYACFEGACGNSCGNPVAKYFWFNDGNTWQDITASIRSGFPNSHNIFLWFPVTSIAVNTDNPYEIWFTIGGFYYIRVVHGVYNVNTATWAWDDYSNGLLTFPANKIVYEKGSNGAVYVATDLGVYYRNKSMNSWQCFNDANNTLPVCVVTDLDINYASNKIRAATFGRGIWQSNLACPTQNNYTDVSVYNNASQFLEYKNDINSTASVDNASNITYRAGDKIDLKPGFQANAYSLGSYFHAFIHNCDIPGNSFRMRPGQDNKNYKEDNIAIQYNNPSVSGTSTILKSRTDKKSGEESYFFKVYPNPNDGTFTLDFKDVTLNGENSLEITDLFGRSIFTKNNIRSAEVISLDLINGMYVVKYSDRKNTYTQKMTISR